jgi:hypothetical protein
MGLFDSLLGRTKQVPANLDALFALPSAAISLELQAGLVPSGHAGICWKPPAGQAPAEVQAELSKLLELDDQDPSTASLTSVEDELGFRWLLVEGSELDTLVTNVHEANSLLAEQGWGPQLLCSVFGFVPAPNADQSAKRLYLVYLYKRGTFYPFCPNGHESRDNEAELRLKAALGADLPIEPDLTRWMALWDLPVP